MKIIIILSLLLLNGCATKHPYAIYDDYNCNQINAETDRVKKELEPYNDPATSALDSAAKVFGTFSNNYNYTSKKDALIHQINYLERLYIHKDCVK